MRGRLAGGARRLDRHLVLLGRWVPRLFFLPTLYAIALGTTLWGITHVDRVVTLTRNGLELSERRIALGFFAGAALVVLAAYALAAWRRRRRVGVLPDSRRLMRWHRYGAFTLAGPLLLVLFVPRLESEHPFFALLYILLITAALVPTAWELAGHLPRPALPWPTDRPEPLWSWRRLAARSARFVGPALAVAVAVGYALFFSHLALTNHWAMRTQVIDLGLYDNIFFQSIHGNPLGCSFLGSGNHVSAHFDPILVLLSPLYLIYPRAELILVLQAAWCGLGAIPVYLLGHHHTRSRGVGVAFAIVYATYPALHGANLYEFHSLTLMATPLLFALYFLMSGRWRGYWALLAVVLLVREDAALLVCFVGLSAILSRQRQAVRAGWLTILIGLAYFGFVKVVVMTSVDFFNDGPESYGFSYYFREMIPQNRSLPDFLTTLLTNPAYVVEVVLKEDKLRYALQLGVPLLFLPLLARQGRLMLLYGATFLFLATKKAVFSPHFQYSTVIYPLAFALAPAGLERLRQRFGRRVLPVGALCLVVAGLLCGWKFGGLAPNSSFRGGFKPVVRELTPTQEAEYRQLRTMVEAIPPEASVMVTNRIGAHASNRAEVYFYREWRDVDYVLVDERDLKKEKKREHDTRVRTGLLRLVRGYRTLRLYAVTRKGP